MGILTDFFIASKEEALSLTETESPAKRFPALECKGVDPVKIATLQTILRGGNLEDVKAVVSLIPEPIREMSDGNIMIFQLPQEVVTNLAALDSPSINAVAEKWFNTDEFKMDRINKALWIPFFRDLQKFATQAVGKDMFLWVCV